MPFDGLTHSLEAAVRLFDLKPIQHSVVIQHKRRQNRKYRPSILYGREDTLALSTAVGLLTMLTAMIAQAFVTSISPLIVFGIGATLFMPAFCLLSGAIKVSGPPEWVWQTHHSTEKLRNVGVPETLVSIAERLHRAVPGVVFHTETLMQKKVVLDPILWASNGGNIVCLGIWEDDEVLYSA